jgi:hypothetical protein
MNETAIPHSSSGNWYGGGPDLEDPSMQEPEFFVARRANWMETISGWSRFCFQIPRWAALGSAAMTMALGLGCSGSGGGGAPASATTVAYVDPPASGYRLVRDSASLGTHLVLDLMGPSGAQLRGVIFYLGLDTSKASWGYPGGTDPYLLNGGTFQLGTGIPLLRGQVSGPVLTAAIYQKGAAPAATAGSQPLATVALDVDAGATGTISLVAQNAKILDASGAAQGVTVAVGTLGVQ